MALSDDTERTRRLEVVDIFAVRSKQFVRLEDDTEHQLIVDASYQRHLDQRKVEQIRSDWDPIAADPLTLSLRSNGKVAIVNGQHMLAAALLEGEPCLLAEIFENLSVPREADLRLKKNNQRPDTALERFHARLAKEREKPGVATAIVALLKEFDTEINKSPSKYVGINCVSTVERLYLRGDEPGTLLRRTLGACKEAYGEIKGDVASAPLFEGLAWFLTSHPEHKHTKLLDQMRRNGPDGIGDVARGFKRAMGGATWLNTYRALVEVYNKAVRGPVGKLELTTSRWTASHEGGWGA